MDSQSELLDRCQVSMRKMNDAYDEEGEEEDVDSGEDNKQPSIDQRGYTKSKRKQVDNIREERRLEDSPLARKSRETIRPEAMRQRSTSRTRHVPQASPSPPPPVAQSEQSVRRIECRRPNRERSRDRRNETSHHEDQRVPSPSQRSRARRDSPENESSEEERHTPSPPPPQKSRVPKYQQQRERTQDYQECEEDMRACSPPQRSRKQRDHRRDRSRDCRSETPYEEEQRTPSPPQRPKKQKHRQRERSNAQRNIPDNQQYDEEQRTPSPPQRPRKQRNHQHERSHEALYDDEEPRTPSPPQRSQKQRKSQHRGERERDSYETSSSYESTSSYEDPTPSPTKMDPRKRKYAIMPVEPEVNEFTKKGLPDVPGHIIDPNRIVPESTVKIFTEKLPTYKVKSSGYGTNLKKKNPRGSRFSVLPPIGKPQVTPQPRREAPAGKQQVTPQPRREAPARQPQSHFEMRPMVSPTRETVSEAYMQKRMAIKGVLKPTQVHKDVLRFSDPKVRPRRLNPSPQPSQPEVVVCDWDQQRQQKCENISRRITGSAITKNTDVHLPKAIQPRPPKSPPTKRAKQQFESKIPRLPQIASNAAQPAQRISRIPQPQPPKLPRSNDAPPQRRYGAGPSHGVYATSRQY